jgi:glycosyltransferase involved in cell wall biosynthesis
MTDWLASATTAVSQAAADRSIGTGAVPPNRITVIPNGFDFSRALVAEGAGSAIRRELRAEDSFLWLTVGRLVPEKGHDILLDAFAHVVRARPTARLAIAGDGPERQALDRAITSLGLSGLATLLGERRDVSTLLDAADAFVLSSRWEGLPMVLLEAAAQALPIVSTDVGGCREVAQPDLGAVLSSPNPRGLASAMLQVIDLSPTERASVGWGLRRHVEANFEIGTVVDRWDALYASLLERRRRRPSAATR